MVQQTFYPRLPRAKNRGGRPPQQQQQRQRRRKRPKRQRRANNMRSNASNVLAPGAGAVTKRAFGSRKGRPSLLCWDAKLPIHLPLPRAVGPYAVIRVTRRFNSSHRVLIFGTFGYPTGKWDSTCCIEDVIGSNPINGPDNAYFYPMPMGEIGAAATLTPSAFTVQVMNPNPLMTTGGVIYAGNMTTQAGFGNSSQTWEDLAANFVEFQSPRLLTAPKLALKGVQISSYPLNMSALADFQEMAGFNYSSGSFTWNTDLTPRGFSPIMVYNPGLSGEVPPDLEYLVTTEYRVRFDLTSIMSASHKFHPPSTDAVWADLMAAGAALGSGVVDIADVVANVGAAAGPFAAIAA